MQPTCLSGAGCRAWRPWGERAERATAMEGVAATSRSEAQDLVWRGQFPDTDPHHPPFQEVRREAHKVRPLPS